MSERAKLPMFGYSPPASEFETAGGCARVCSDISEVRRLLNLRMQQLGPDADLALYHDEMRRLATMWGEAKRLQTKLFDSADPTREAFPRALMRVVKSHVSREQYQAWCAEAQELMERQQGNPSTARGVVLEPRSTGGGMRERKS